MSPLSHPPLLLLLTGALLSAAPACRACSNFLLAADDKAAMSGRTMDLGFWDGFSLVAVPPGSVSPVHSNASATNQYGFLSIYPSVGEDQVRGLVKSSAAGMNTFGLSCDLQTLLGTKYPPYPKDPRTEAVLVDRFCEWVLGSFSTVGELKAALASPDEANKQDHGSNGEEEAAKKQDGKEEEEEGGDRRSGGKQQPAKVRVVGSDALWQNHFVVRDRFGRSLVVEFLQGEVRRIERQTGRQLIDSLVGQ